MKKYVQLMVMLSALTVLSACGKGTEATAAADKAVAAGSSWDATNACALLDKATVGAALGDPVTETSLAFVNKASGANAATSECTYQLSGGGSATLMTRRSPIADNTPEAIALARKSTEQALAAFGKAKVEDIDGLGKAAFYVPAVKQMNVFLDDDKFVVLTLSSLPADKAKTVAMDLVRKISPDAHGS